MTTNTPELPVLVQVARDIVITARRTDDLGSLTVKTVRRQVERDFALAEGTLDESRTKTALREAVNAALVETLLVEEKPVEKRKRSPEESDVELVEEVKPKKVKKEGKKQAAKPTPDEEDPEDGGTSQKRKKKSRVVAKSRAMILTDSDDDKDAIVPQPSASTSKAKKKTKESTSKKQSKKAAGSAESEKAQSEHSDLSDEPAPKKRTKGKTKEGTKTKARKGKTDKAESELSPDEQTIKRLKSFVSACGLRKVWSKEFANLPLPKEQIAHLKEILAEVGMTGRYSLEQAKAIKVKRDLARELNDVVEFERKAGASRGNKKKPQTGGKRIAELDTNSEISESSDDDDDPKSPVKKTSSASKSIMQYLANQSSGEE